MSFDADNGEKIVKDTKSEKEVKSPGRLAAEERAERIKLAEEYRRKLEAEKAPVQPKKTKAAEQKEQEKLERIAREQEAARAKLEEQRLESERRISAAREKLASITENIKKTEATVSIPEVVKVEKPVVAIKAEAVPAKTVEPVKLENLVVHIPVQSFSMPSVAEDNEAEPNEQTCTVNGYYMQPAYYPPMPQPMVYAPIPEAAQENKIEITQPKPKAQSSSNPQPQAPATPAPKAIPIKKENEAKENPFKRPIICYGAAVGNGGWEHEIADDEPVASAAVGVDPSSVSAEVSGENKAAETATASASTDTQ